MSEEHGSYYIPEPSKWPVIGSLGLFFIFAGLANWLHEVFYGPYLFFIGALILVYMIFGWFAEVIHENEKGLFDQQVDRTYRWAMMWFIFSEVMFFAAFFGVLLYARMFSVPWLSGVGHGEMSHYVIWPGFKAMWPLLKNPDPSQFVNPGKAMAAWGIPAINTVILLSSGVTVTWAHWALKKNARLQLIFGLLLTVILGFLFLGLQAAEYHEAYTELGLKLNTGIYGTTFFMLTGFHGAHVTIGAIMLTVMLVRSIKGHFTPENHFAFEAAAWYWHFVDVVWLGLFIFVYWL